MTTHQTIWLIILIPFMSIYAFIEIRRGMNILKHNRPSLNFVLKIRIKLIELFSGKDAAEKYQEQILANPKEMKTLALNSVFGGVATIVVVMIWVVVLYNSLGK